MITCNGVVGLCLLVGGLRHGEQSFRIEGTGSGLAALAVLCSLVLVLPTFTVSAPDNAYSTPQLVFVAMSSLALWLVFIFIQTIRHRDYFLPVESPENETIHAAPPGIREAWTSFVLLLSRSSESWDSQKRCRRASSVRWSPLTRPSPS